MSTAAEVLKLSYREPSHFIDRRGTEVLSHFVCEPLWQAGEAIDVCIS